MKWTREQNGTYVAGPYRVERLVGSTWRASGPGMEPEVNWHGKDLAQDECRRAAEQRALGFAVPVVGDIVAVGDRRGQVTTKLDTDNGSPLWCIRFARGKRLCLTRQEFAVVVP